VIGFVGHTAALDNLPGVAMPIELLSESQQRELEQQQEVEFDESWLIDEHGQPTIEADLLDGFLDEVDWSYVFDDPDAAEAIIETTGYACRDGNGWIECGKDDPGAVEVVIQSIDGEAMSEMVDMDDLSGMLEGYINDRIDETTLEGKAIREAGLAMLDEKSKWPKKGRFRAMHKAGMKDVVNRMLGAMLAKRVIQRAGDKAIDTGGKRMTKSGAPIVTGPQSERGYRGGSYQKYAAGYSTGDSKGHRNYGKYTGRASAKTAAKKAVLKYKKAATKKAALKAMASKDKAKIKKAVAKAKTKKTAKKMGESVQRLPTGQLVMENSQLIGAALRVGQGGCDALAESVKK
jgi:hypothetical protein